jgi:lysophospholipid acyltransferase (LPLAT)-like uncharacterized protein
LPLAKRLLRSEAARRLAAWAIACYIRLCWATGRWRVVNDAVPAAFWARGEPFILAFWHGRLLMMTCCWRRGHAFRMLISRHADGQIISGAIARLGLGAVHGSSRRPGKDRDKGGVAALRAMMKLLKDGVSIGIAPDGPRGPRMRAGPGVVAAARLSGAAVLPAACACSPRRLLATWDRFQAPLPFARGAIVWGEPLRVARDEDEETARRRIEAAITAATLEADRLVGEPTPEPA